MTPLYEAYLNGYAFPKKTVLKGWHSWLVVESHTLGLGVRFRTWREAMDYALSHC